MVKNIFNIPAGCSTVDILAQELLSQNTDFGLTDTLVLLPSRRACRELRDAFVRQNGMKPTILPQIMPLGEVDEDELFFADNSEQTLNLPPAISQTERMLLFTRLINAGQKGINGSYSLAQASYLATELSKLFDTVENEELNFSDLADLVPAEYAVHWQKTLDFLKIVTEVFPKIMEERGVIGPAQRKIALLHFQSELWKKYPPKQKIVIAGTTGAFPAIRELIKTVSELPLGTVYLNDIDRCLEDDAWEDIDESHPQFETKQLLDFLEIKRNEIIDVDCDSNHEREKLISEVMRPATSTDSWRNININTFSPQVVNGVHFICCHEIKTEALSIAALMRRNLETPEKTTALVTTDRNLARYVASELKRWNINVDDSAGRPLTQTPVGIFLRLIVQCCENNFNNIDLLSLLKHPLCRGGKDTGDYRQLVRKCELELIRAQKHNPELENFLTAQKEILHPLFELYQQPQADFKQLLTAHLKAAEILSASAQKEGADNLWRGDDGEAAARLFSNLLENADTLPIIPQNQYGDFITAQMSAVTVRPKYGTHPRLKILGPIEARLSGFDTVIIGGVNEGTFPKMPSSDAWMSRPMKKDFGFPLPEKNIGITAHDFAHLLAQKEVYLTRAERVDGTPTTKSRWWMRLETVLTAAKINIKNLYEQDIVKAAEYLNQAQNYRPISQPRPKPPLEARPRELWASAIENLMRDPYIIYAKYILGLKPLDDIDHQPDIVDLGNIVHKILEKFNKDYPRQLPDDAKEILLQIGQQQFSEAGIDIQTLAFWQPSLKKMIDWILEQEKSYRTDINRVYCEVEGQYSFDSFGGKFTIGAKADRVDLTKDGKINIIDYKTGQARKTKEVSLGYAPQLPIEGIIAAAGGFKGIDAAEVQSLRYWRLGKEEICIDKNIKEILQRNLNNIKQLIAIFDNPDKPYLTQPNPKYAPTYSDYEHLSRINEWGISDKNDNS